MNAVPVMIAAVSYVVSRDELIDIATHNRNYSGNYESVAGICEARDDFLEHKDDYIYRLTADW